MKHLIRHPKHKKSGGKKYQEYWSWATSWRHSGTSQSEAFKQDEASKWFGVYTEFSVNSTRVTTLIETDRLRRLLEISHVYRDKSSERQYPSIASFVGETGAGKSTLIRTLMYHALLDRTPDQELDAPVPGAQSGSSALISTTGEVNLYSDPNTLGTENPTFYADCEGLMGTEPVASQFQTNWSRGHRKYLIETKYGEHMDRATAVKSLYPRFLYIFSDVICYVTRNHRAWADSCVRLLEWSIAGAQGSINQHTLPALIIILNGPAVENEEWIRDSQAATRDFFNAVSKEIAAHAKLGDWARQRGDKTMEELLARSFSSVYVHYVPLQGYLDAGDNATVFQQTTRLANRIREDTKRVQEERAAAWTRFSSKDLSLVVTYAFKHIASGSTAPFDFGQCRQQLSVPKSIEDSFREFIGVCLKSDTGKRFDEIASSLACKILRASFRSEEKGVIYPDAVFNRDIREICKRAFIHSQDMSAVCSYVDPEGGQRCVNTKAGHALGHQTASGNLLADGPFAGVSFDPELFVSTIQSSVRLYIRQIDSHNPSNTADWRRQATDVDRSINARLRALGLYPQWDGSCSAVSRATMNSKVCYGCLFDRPEYSLPCGHVICAGCLVDFDQTPLGEQYPGFHTHVECFICGARGGGSWPYTIHSKPGLAGLRVLSLDGGGVRSILQIGVLHRLETLLDLGIPIGNYFDLIAGTSAGGMIALGLGVQGLPAATCRDKFNLFCTTGFQEKIGTKIPTVGWIARWICGSIYKTEPLEMAMKSVFSGQPRKNLFGLTTNTRVAITTTVNSLRFLLANYHRGDGKFYLDSDTPLENVARCTSAAPMYFEPVSHDGVECRDGGLKDNNPIQLAVNECKKIWGDSIDFDVLLSIGSGKAKESQDQPASNFIIPEWLQAALTALLSNLNGESEWERFYNSQEKRILERACRLNVELDVEQEPALDDVSSIPNMETVADTYPFQFQWTRSDFDPFSDFPGDDALSAVADRIRGSMFFFHPTSITPAGDIYSIQGYIGCRLRPGDRGYAQLIHKTKDFIVKGFSVGAPMTPDYKLMKYEVNFQHQSSEPIRIDVNFDAEHSVAISGFPMTLQALRNYWDIHCDDHLQQQTSLNTHEEVSGKLATSVSKFKLDGADQE
ncbi:uncharacterized protein DNG_00940 [Cephalotrichum gorgonifer]|uniref:PNPLA domain-containing protein n=1 Tax=Cephalotrichum gorgonifer TaxID=2041049 RepID=A0AAE8MR52_9PEZI|nr:uncharacterized protein DNG_00940 [Cephalotrichum gorgonifer]